MRIAPKTVSSNLLSVVLLEFRDCEITIDLVLRIIPVALYVFFDNIDL